MASFLEWRELAGVSAGAPEVGKSDPGEKFHALGPIYTHVTRDVDAAWEKILPHAVHCVESLCRVDARGLASAAAGPFARGVDPHDLRNSGPTGADTGTGGSDD